MPIDRQEPNPDNLRLTKLDVVRRELTSAIGIFFAQRDPVSIHLLVCAAAEILERLNKRAGNKTFRDELLERIKPERHREWNQLFSETYNYMKHADRDPDVTYEYFNPRINEILLFGAVLGYWSLEEPTDLMLLYLAWYNKFHSDLIIPGNDTLDALAMTAAAWPNDRDEAIGLAHDLVESKRWYHTV